MSDSLREQIIQAIVTRLGTIRTANGYNTNIGARVERARPVFGPEELPAVSVTPQPEETFRRYGATQCIMPVLLEASMLHGSLNPSVVAEKILADFIDCMTEPGIFESLIERIVYASGGPEDYPGSGDQVTGCPATFIIYYSI